MLTDELVDVLGSLPGNINAKLPHHRDGFRAYRLRVRAGAEDLVGISEFVAKQTFRHLASRRISSAENQHSFFVRQRFPLLGLAALRHSAGETSDACGCRRRRPIA